jgi:hypothetical protein
VVRTHRKAAAHFAERGPVGRGEFLSRVPKNKKGAGRFDLRKNTGKSVASEKKLCYNYDMLKTEFCSLKAVDEPLSESRTGAEILRPFCCGKRVFLLRESIRPSRQGAMPDISRRGRRYGLMLRG